jgi:predicted RNA binding protein YcfA (HicA-like mRNA interferase family)
MSSNLPVLKSKEIISSLLRIGFQFYRQKGSHRIYVFDEKQVIVPVHSKDMKKEPCLILLKKLA